MSRSLCRKTFDARLERPGLCARQPQRIGPINRHEHELRLVRLHARSQLDLACAVVHGVDDARSHLIGEVLAKRRRVPFELTWNGCTRFAESCSSIRPPSRRPSLDFEALDRHRDAVEGDSAIGAYSARCRAGYSQVVRTSGQAREIDRCADRRGGA